MEHSKRLKGDIIGDRKVSPNDILYEIYIDKRQPATARVAAIRLYKELDIPEESEDPYLAYLKMKSKKEKSKIKNGIESSSTPSTSHIQEKDGNTNTKT